MRVRDFGDLGDRTPLEEAADEVIASFKAVGADRNGLVKWTVDPIAVRKLIVARHDLKLAKHRGEAAHGEQEEERE